MNLYSIDDYRETASRALSGTGAFLRVSRKRGLFVTDAKRRGCDIGAFLEKLPGWTFFEDEGLLYLTPDYGFDGETAEIYTEILKADTEKREKLIRTNLAIAMRTKDLGKKELFTILYERMIER